MKSPSLFYPLKLQQERARKAPGVYVHPQISSAFPTSGSSEGSSCGRRWPPSVSQYWLRSVFTLPLLFCSLDEMMLRLQREKPEIQESTSALAKIGCFLTSSNLKKYFLVLRARDERKPYITGGEGGIG